MHGRPLERLARSLPAAFVLTVLAGGLPGDVRAADPTSLDGYNIVRVAPGLATSDSVIGLLAPYHAGHPESLEGAPSMDISMRTHGDTMVVDLRLGGYLDDSVSGEEYRALIIQNSNGQWEILDLGQRNICGRGANAGRPQADPCP